jgi:hypothetical protein
MRHVVIHVFLDDPYSTVSLCFFLAGYCIIASRPPFVLVDYSITKDQIVKVINCVRVPADLPFRSEVFDIQS